MRSFVFKDAIEILIWVIQELFMKGEIRELTEFVDKTKIMQTILSQVSWYYEKVFEIKQRESAYF